MGIRMVTPVSEVDNIMYESFKILKDKIINSLAKLGEECIVKIRDRSGSDSWFDHTGNLRSSIGYSVFNYGVKQVQSAFSIVRQGAQGSADGKKMISQLASKYANAYALVVVAAMNYADYVESLKNKDVLASTELWAKSVIDARLERAKKDAICEINKLAI